MNYKGLIRNLCIVILFLFSFFGLQAQRETTDIFDKLVKHYSVNLIYDINELKELELNKVKICQSTISNDLDNLFANQLLEYKKIGGKTYIIKRIKEDMELKEPKEDNYRIQ